MQKFLTVIAPASRPVMGTPETGGVAAHQENAAKLPLKAQTGWSFCNIIRDDHPVRAKIKDAFGDIYLIARPPLLSQESP